VSEKKENPLASYFSIVLAIALMLIGILISKMWFEEGDP